MTNESKENLKELALKIGKWNNWGYVEGHEPSESEKLMDAIVSQCYNIADGEHNGCYIKESREEYLEFLYDVYDKLINKGCKWCDN